MNIILIMLIVVVSCLVTWWITLKIFKRETRKKVLEGHTCPFQNACTMYDTYNTAEAARRVARLMLENMENEEEYKKQIYELLTYKKNESEKKGE